MKLSYRITLIVIATVTGFSSLFFAAPPVHASAGTVYFTPGSGRFDPGSTFTIDVKTTVQNPGTILGGARVSVTYPTSMVSVVSTSTTGNSMRGSVSKTAGQLKYSASVAPPRYGTDLLLFRVTFKALATGNFTLNFTSASQVNDGPTTKQSSTYSIQPASCPAGQVGTPPNCSVPPTPKPAPTPSPKPTPTPTPTPQTPAPTQTVPEPNPDASTDITPIQTDANDLSINDVTAKPSWQGNTINWMTSLPEATSKIEIGTSKNALKAGPEVTKQEDGSLLATMKDLSPGTRYYYLITAVSNADPTKKATYSGAITTRGYPVLLTVNQDGVPLQGAKITIDKGSYTTDKAGAVLLELANKPYSATITADNNISKSVTFTVAKRDIPPNGSDPEMQRVSLNVTAADASSTTDAAPPIGLIVGSVIGGLALIGGFLLFLVYRRRRSEQLAIPVAITDEYTWTQASSTALSPTSTDIATYDALPEEQQYNQIAAVEQEDPYMPEQQITSYPVSSEQIIDPALVTYASDRSPPVDNLEQTAPLTEEMDPIEVQPAQEDATPVETNTPVLPITEPSMTQPTGPIPANETDPAPSSNTEPSAVYDTSTGELDIIHHGTKPTHAGGAQ